MTVTVLKKEPTVRERAEHEVRLELAAKALEKMKRILRDLAAAEAVVRGINLQIVDLEQQIADGTV